MVRLVGVGKQYGGVTALAELSLELHAGEALALVGENGAGKSTLVNLLAGATAPSHGTIEMDGRTFAALTPDQARAHGIRVVHQELMVVDRLTVAENVFLGQEPRRLGLLPARATMRRRASELLAALGVPLDPDARVGTLSVGQKQAVEIAKGLAFDAKLFVLDEPTAPLTPAEVARLYRVVRELKARGVALLYISHRLQEVFDLCERVVVLRDGREVFRGAVAGLTRRELVRHMVGRELAGGDEEAPPHHPQRTIGARRLEVTGLSAGPRLRDLTFHVRAGEVVGLAGLVGAGRTEALRALFGADRRTAGTIRMDGRTIAPRSPSEAIAAGLALVPEDRKAQGVILARPVAENFALVVLRKLAWLGVLDRRRMQRVVEALVAKLRVKAPTLAAPVGSLSGGNQQKVVLGRWLAGRFPVLLLDEPTRGIDVGARHEIWQVLRDLSRDGIAQLIVSSSLPELLALCDRLYVLRDGRLVGELAAGATPEEVMQLAAR